MRPTDIDAAYNMCLTLEQAILNDNLDSMGRDDRDLDLVKCRILGWLLHHLQNETGFNLVIQEISATLGSRGSLLALGQTYLEHFIPVSSCAPPPGFVVIGFNNCFYSQNS